MGTPTQYKDESELVHCKCPRCKTTFDQKLFVFNYNPKTFYRKYCKECREIIRYSENQYADDIIYISTSAKQSKKHKLKGD